VDHRWAGRHQAAHELLEGLVKEDAVEVTLFEPDGVVAEDVEGGDDVHSSEVTC